MRQSCGRSSSKTLGTVDDRAGAGATRLGTERQGPEQVCRPFVSQIQTCLDWHGSTWLALVANFKRLGFNWPAYLDSTAPGTGANAELRRLRNAVLGDLEKILKARAAWLRWPLGERLDRMALARAGDQPA